MRETCARALAAALMTGAIAGVVGMAALVRTPSEAGAPMSAPPASLQHSVRLKAEPAPRPRTHQAPLVTRHVIHVQARPSPSGPSLAVVRRYAAPRRPARPRQLASITPARQTAPAPAAAPADATPQPPAPPPAADPAPSSAEPDGQDEHEDDGSGHGHGHADGHENQDD